VCAPQARRGAARAALRARASARAREQRAHRTSTMKTSVLLSSIFFIADSVVSGNFRIWWRSAAARRRRVSAWRALRVPKCVLWKPY
jgi:hypothetical protein